MYISIAEVLNKRLKEAVAEKHGHKVGLNWPASVVDPLNAKIDALNADGWDDEAARLSSVATLREAVVEHFPHIEAPKPPPKAKAKAQKGAK